MPTTLDYSLLPPPDDSLSSAIIREQFVQTYRHQLLSTSAFWLADNPTLVVALGTSAKPETKLLYVLEADLAQYGYDHLPASLIQKATLETASYTLAIEPIWLQGTETCKDNWDGVMAVCQAINDAGIDRHSVVVAVGGGAFLDMVGFGCAIAHRGVQLLRVPTTILAQADSGVGVKSAINAFGKKNFLGAFAVPLAVINDAAFLASLSPDLIRAGLAEAVKVALVKDAAFFAQLELDAVDAIEGNLDKLQQVIQQSALLHLRHICQGGDPFEQGSSRPLDFGHWSAHKAEGLTNFRIAHGLAVAAGLHLDALYSQRMGWLPPEDYTRVKSLLVRMGYDLALGPYGLSPTAGQTTHPLLAGLNEFREHLGGRLTLLMLRGIGQPIEVHELDDQIITQAIIDLVA